MSAPGTGDRPIVLLLHGPNLNLLGQREPEVYGTATLADHVATATRDRGGAHGLALEAFQSNHEGDLVDAIHAARGRCAAIVINPGAFTHYAWSIHDALAAFDGVDRRAAPLEPERPGGVAPHQRHRSGRDRQHRGLRRRRLPTGHRSRRPLRSSDAVAAGIARRRPWTAGRPPVRLRPCRGGASSRRRVRAGLRDAGCDALLVTDLMNVRYLTGFTGSAARLLVLGPTSWCS